ncbi:MAG: hypothetical protein HPY81_04030 [Firmicutes bacterium]|nr:hypothetical protein [Bacillota bacterium]
MTDDSETRIIVKLNQKINELAVAIEKMKLAEYVELLNRPWRLLYINFMAGLARGLGTAVGFTILGAVVLIILERLLVWNLPVLGGFIAEIIKIVQTEIMR